MYLENVLQCVRRNFWVSRKHYQDGGKKRKIPKLLSAASVCCYLALVTTDVLKRDNVCWWFSLTASRLAELRSQPLSWRVLHRVSGPALCLQTGANLINQPIHQCMGPPLRCSGFSCEVTFKLNKRLENILAFVQLQSKHSLEAPNRRNKNL